MFWFDQVRVILLLMIDLNIVNICGYQLLIIGPKNKKKLDENIRNIWVSLILLKVKRLKML